MNRENTFLEGRQVWIDFIKGLLILFVVLGHSLAGAKATNSDIIGVSHYFIYAIHMPMFMLISGLLSKRPVTFKKAIKHYLIPYILFDILYMVWLSLRGGKVEWNVLLPTYVYWYILALFFMRLLLSKCRRGRVAVIFLILSFFSPLICEEMWNILAIGRVILLYPIFYIGYLIPISSLEKIRKKNNLKVISIILGLFSIIIEAIFLINGIVDVTWATHDYSSVFKDYFLKVIFIYLFVICEFVFLCAVAPSKVSFINRWGRNSICVYLIHPFLVDIIKAIINRIGMANTGITFILYFFFAILITDVLSKDSIKRLYDIMLNTITTLLRINVSG